MHGSALNAFRNFSIVDSDGVVLTSAFVDQWGNLQFDGLNHYFNSYDKLYLRGSVSSKVSGYVVTSIELGEDVAAEELGANQYMDVEAGLGQTFPMTVQTNLNQNALWAEADYHTTESQMVWAGIENFDFFSFDVNAWYTNEDVMIENVIIKIYGDAELDSVSIVDSFGNVIKTVYLSQSGYVAFDAVDYLLEEGYMETFSIQADVSEAADYGDTFYACVEVGGDIGTTGLSSGLSMPASGRFPICGNVMTVGGGSVLDIDLSVGSPSGVIYTGDDTEILEVDFSAEEAYEDILVEDVFFEVGDGAAYDEFRLYADGTYLGSAYHNNYEVAFTDIDYVVPEGEVVDFELKVDLPFFGRYSGWVQASIYDATDVVAIGMDTGEYVAVSGGAVGNFLKIVY